MGTGRARAFGPAALLLAAWAVCLAPAARLAADTPPGQAQLTAWLTGYGGVALSATAQQGSNPIQYIAIAAQSSAGSSWLLDVVSPSAGVSTGPDALPACGSVTLTAQAVDTNGEVGVTSTPVALIAPCGPTISPGFGPDPSTSTDEDLSWSDNPAPGQATQAYIVAAAAGTSSSSVASLSSTADPLQYQLAVTTATSAVLALGTGPGGLAYQNLYYRVYAVDQNGVTSAASAGYSDYAYSYGVPALASWNSNSGGNLSFSTPDFAAVTTVASLTYTLYGASSSAGTFNALTSVPSLALAQAQAAGLGLTLTGQPSYSWYYLQVGDSAGVGSPLSPPAAALLHVPPLAAPAVVSGTVVGSGVELAWAPVPCATGYALYRTDLSPAAAVVTQAASAFGSQDGLLEYTDSSSYVASPPSPQSGGLAYAVLAYASLSSSVLSGGSGSETGALGASVTGVPDPAGAAAPATLSALGTGKANTVQLSWAASSSFNANSKGPVSTYLVYYSTQGISPLGPGVTSTAVGASLTTLTLTGFPSGAPLPDGTLAWFWVSADSGVAPGPFSPAAWAFPHTAPLGPTLTAGVLPFGGGVSLTASVTGTPDVPLSEVRVYSSASSVTPLVSLDPSALSTTLSAGLLPCGSAVTLTAQAVDVQGDTGAAGAGVWLDPPCGPTATAQSLGSDGSLTLGWSQPTGGSGDGYAVFSATGPGWPASQAALLTLTSATSFAVPAAPGASPWYSVAAVDPRGVTSPASAQVGLLQPPSGLEALPEAASVALSWSAPASGDSVGLAGYRVYYSSAAAFLSGASVLGAGPGASSLTASAQALGLTVTGLGNLSAYAFAVASLGASDAVSGAAGASVSATVGLQGPTLSAVGTTPALQTSAVFYPLTSSGAAAPDTQLLLQWSLGSYTPTSTTVYTLYEATDAPSSPQTFDTLTPVASAAITSASAAQQLTLSVGASGPAWYFLNVSDSGGVDVGADTSDARSVAAAVFAPNLAPVSSLSLAAPPGDGRVELAWGSVPYADSYLVYRATQDVPAAWRSGVTHTALSTSSTPATFTQLADVAADSVSQDYTYTDTNPSDNAMNAYEVVASLGVSPSGRVYGPVGATVTCVPQTLPQDPGFWLWPGGSDGTVGDPATGGDVAGVSGYAITVAATASPAGGALVEWTPSGEGDYPLAYYDVWRGYSAQSLSCVGSVAASTTSSSGALVSYIDPSPPQPLASLVYGVSAIDTHGNSSPDTVTGSVQLPLEWPAPVQESVPGPSGLCGGYCAGSGQVLLSWVPGVNYVGVTPPSGAEVFITQTAGTFPFAAWQVERVNAPGAAPVVLTGPAGVAVGDGVAVAVSPTGSLVSLTQVTLTDLSPPAGSPLYLISAVDTQGRAGTPLGVSITVPVSSYRSVPLAVTGLTVTPAVVSLSANALPVLGEQLSWTPNAAQDDVAYYQVSRQDSHGTTYLNSTAASFTDPAGESDSAGSVLTYTVQAFNAQNVSGPTSIGVALTLAPPAPSCVNLTADIPAGVALSPAVGLHWPDVLNLQGGGVSGSAAAYTVYQVSSGPTYTPVSGCVGVSLSAECADLAPQAQDTYAVQSGVYPNGVPVSSTVYSQSLSVTYNATAPAAPAFLSATSRASGVALTWASSPGAYEYWVYRSSAALGSLPPPYADYLARTTGTAFTDAGTSPTAGGGGDAVQPYYAVAAASPWVVGGSLSVTAGLAPPTGLSAFAGGVGQSPDVSPTVTLLWQASLSSAVTGYSVWRSTSGASGASFVASVSGTSYVDGGQLGTLAGLTNTVLTYTVMAYGAGLSSACPAPATVTAYDLPRAPVALQGQGIADGVDASWKPDYAPQGVTSYAVAWTVLAGGSSGLTLVAASAADWSLGGLLPGQSVAVSVQAFNSAGASPWAGPVTPTASSVGPPPVPAWATAYSGLAPGAAGTSGCAIGLNVSATGQSALVVYRSPAPGATLPATPGPYAPLRLSDCAGGPSSPYYLTTLPGTLLSLTDTSVSALYPYSYAVTALGSQGLPAGESLPLAVSPSSCVAYNAWSAPATFGGQAGNAQVSLWWTPPASSGQGSYPLSGYLLYRQTGGAGTPPAPDAGFPVFLPKTQTAYTDRAVQNLEPGESGGYGYWMTCQDTQGNQSLSASAGTLIPVGLLPPPTVLTATPENNSVVLTWVVPQSDVQAGASYNVYRRLTGSGAVYGPAQPNLYRIEPNANYPTAVSLVAQSATDPPGLPNSPPNLVTECYAITAVDAAGEGPKSQDVCTTPFNQIVPSDWGVQYWSAPTVSVPSQEGDPISIALHWDAIPYSGNSNPSGTHSGGYAMGEYLIERSSNGGASFTTVGTKLASVSDTSTTLLPYTDNTATKGESYVYEIVPVDADGNQGQPYQTQTVQLPSGQNSLYVYRNSFDPKAGGSVNIQVGLQQSGNYWVKVYTLNGEYVKTLIPAANISGYSWGTTGNPYLSTIATWDGTNSRGQVVASGVYLLHLQGPGFSADARVAVIK